MQLNPLDGIILLAYLGVVLGMGLYYARRNTDTEQYFVSGRSLPGWVIGISMIGTTISSITFIAFPADAFKTAWLRSLPMAMVIVAVFIATRFFLPFFRRGNITSAYEYLGARFGPSVEVYGACTFIFGELVRVSLILYLLSLIVHEITGISPTASVLLCGAFIALYTAVGGIDAVIWTDVVQTVALVAGGLLCLGAIVARLPGGLEQIITVGVAEGKFSFSELVDGTLQPVSWDLSLSRKTGSMMLLVGMVIFLTTFAANQNAVQRYCAAKSLREARKAMFISSFSLVPIMVFFMFLGTSLFVFFHVFPTTESTLILTGEGGRRAEQIMPFFILNFLPPGLAGLVLAAALAAAMSSLDSSINAVATVGIVDLYRRHLVKGRADRHYLKVARAGSLLVAAGMMAGALLLLHTETTTLIDTFIILTSLLGAGLLGMYLLGFLTRRGDARAVWIGIICTLLFTGWTVIAQYAPGRLPALLQVPFDLYYTGLIGNVLFFVLGFLAASLLPARPRAQTHLNIWQLDETLVE